MKWIQIAENYWVSPQIDEQDVTLAADEGFEVIMCNRPDGESFDQVESRIIQSATEAAGLSYLFLPMTGPSFETNYLTQVQQLVDEGKKVLAYCRSGNRCNLLFNAAIHN